MLKENNSRKIRKGDILLNEFNKKKIKKQTV